MNRLSFLGFLVLCGLSGCTTMYVHPSRGDAATLVIKNNSDLDVVTQSFQVASDCSGGKQDFNKLRLIPALGQLVVKVNPNQPFSFFVSYHRISYPEIKYVNLPMTFTPGPNGNYTITFSVYGSRYKAEMTNDAGLQEPSFVVRKWRIPFLESGSFCS